MKRKWMKTAAVALLAAVLCAACTKEDVVSALVETYYGYNSQFHRPGCSVIQNVQNSALSKFTAREDAIKLGLTACPVCRP